MVNKWSSSISSNIVVGYDYITDLDNLINKITLNC